MDTNDLDRRFLLGGLAGVAGISALAAMSSAGPLNPPAGPVAPTPGPEPRTPVNSTTCPGDASSVYVISQPGSYYLTANIAGQTGKTSIMITASRVSLDFMGFAVVGGDVGVNFSSCTQGATIRNGAVIGVSRHGLLGNGATSGPSLIEEMRVYTCSLSGILVNYGSMVRRCNVSSCLSMGIVLGTRCIAEQCIVSACSTAGIYLSDPGAVVRGCISSDNAGAGIYLDGGWGRVTGNLLRYNGFYSVNRDGIRITTTGNVVEDNNLSFSYYGIECMTAGNLFVRNTVTACTTPFYLVAGNNFGPIVNLAGSGSSAVVNGGAAASTLTSTDPQANYVI